MKIYVLLALILASFSLNGIRAPRLGQLKQTVRLLKQTQQSQAQTIKQLNQNLNTHHKNRPNNSQKPYAISPFEGIVGGFLMVYGFLRLIF